MIESNRARALLKRWIGAERDLLKHIVYKRQRPPIHSLDQRIPGFRYLLGLGIEHHLQDNLEREPHHLALDVDLIAVTPTVNKPCTLARDNCAPVEDALFVKSRRNHAFAPAMMVALARQNATSGEALQDRWRGPRNLSLWGGKGLL
jgi:hypothetical protein